jgi:hypothetical protein
MAESRLDGSGDIFYGEERVARVRFRLAATARTGRAAGMDGEMAVIDGGPLAMERRNYILRCADGREVAFFVTAMPQSNNEATYAVGTVGTIVPPTPA